MAVKVQVIEIAQMNELINGVNAIRLAVETNSYPDQISVKELASSGEPLPEPAPILKMGTGEMELFFREDETTLPMELQPVIAPTANWFKYQQISPSGNLYHISGQYIANDVAQIPLATLAAYNSANGTNFAADATKYEFLKIPFMRLEGIDVTLHSMIDHLWKNTGNSNETDWLEPLSAISIADSDEVKLKYSESDNRYPVIFGDDLIWDINISFSGIVEGYIPE